MSNQGTWLVTLSGSFNESGIAFRVDQSENTVAFFAELYVTGNFLVPARIVFLKHSGRMEYFALLAKVAQGFFV
ncbi:MAG: hypothetical protein C9355_04090 [Thalassolituus maritimus]|uniref:Uncharacterized protein n=1 Tax=Thalassolituus maritimus TaxID=484498 RepID=A0A1N7KNZ4_9GAMM|nr:hypothetical protein [Thalassolituus maritimus]TPD55285.1 MAG: hypothetical protein C9355_04090 [Thalassolituus maritimus]SIS63315.1 hypothetical protein SAMN05421686_10315 [Thalassolituus maritimus]